MANKHCSETNVCNKTLASARNPRDCFMTPLFSSLRRELKFSRTTPTYTRRAHPTLTCTPHKPKLNFLASCCSLPGRSKYSCLLCTLKGARILFGVSSVVGSSGFIAGRKAGEDRRETKAEPGRQQPIAPANPTYVARVLFGGGGLSPWFSQPAAVVTSIQSPATNQPSFTLQKS